MMDKKYKERKCCFCTNHWKDEIIWNFKYIPNIDASACYLSACVECISHTNLVFVVYAVMLLNTSSRNISANPRTIRLWMGECDELFSSVSCWLS